MEELPVAAALFAGLCLLLLHRLLSRRGKAAGKLPPSPPAWPILGHLHLLGNLPHQSLMKLANKYGAYMMLKLGIVDVLVVSTSEGARQVLKVHDQAFASRPRTTASEIFGYGGQDMGWAPYGEHWRNLKKFGTLELFTAKRVEMSRPFRTREVGILLRNLFRAAGEGVSQGVSVNLSKLVLDATFGIMLRQVMNKSFTDVDDGSDDKAEALQFKETISEAFLLGSGSQLGDFIPYLRWMDKHIPRMKVLLGRFDGYLQKQMNEHYKDWKNSEEQVKDFIDVMLSNGMVPSDVRMKGLALDIIAAGMDTSAVTVEWAMSELMLNPPLMKRAQEELRQVVGEDRLLDESDLPKLKYLHAVVKETMRLHPAAPLLVPHESTEVCELNQYVIPAKTRLFVNAYAIGRDPAVWDDPSAFNPDRFMGDDATDIRGQHFEVIPFGSGRRMCPGMLLGLTTVQLLLGSLLHTFDWSLPTDGAVIDLTEIFGLTVRKASPLSLRLHPRLTTLTSMV